LDRDDGQQPSGGGHDEIDEQLRQGHDDTSRVCSFEARPAARPIAPRLALASQASERRRSRVA
ncbi:MAG TPA: hypothetical protein VMF30_00785, partial [Pirellulales bacterium]|nr:hypothetical protein [Pirellulales bacterium]